MESDFILRKNIEHFQNLLAAGGLNARQADVVSDLLKKEIDALATLTKPNPRRSDARPSG